MFTHFIKKWNTISLSLSEHSLVLHPVFLAVSAVDISVLLDTETLFFGTSLIVSCLCLQLYKKTPAAICNMDSSQIPPLPDIGGLIASLLDQQSDIAAHNRMGLSCVIPDVELADSNRCTPCLLLHAKCCEADLVGVGYGCVVRLVWWGWAMARLVWWGWAMAVL